MGNNSFATKTKSKLVPKNLKLDKVTFSPTMILYILFLSRIARKKLAVGDSH